jgi:alkylation response protein AidB-like acyl-CoA dehydrogenase
MSVADLSQAPVLCETTDPSVTMGGVLMGAAMMVGLAEKARDMIVDYAKIRQTFGRPIGAYQAVRHPCAEMAVRCEEAKSQLFLASVAVADGQSDAALQVSAARVLAENAALLNADDTIQLHGGIGVTDEFDTHYLIKRANVMAGWFGYRRAHLESVLNTPLQALSGAK